MIVFVSERIYSKTGAICNNATLSSNSIRERKVSWQFNQVLSQKHHHEIKYFWMSITYMKITRCTLNVENVDIGICWRQSSSLKIEYFCGNIYRLKTRIKTKGSKILKIFRLSLRMLTSKKMKNCLCQKN